jgi:K+-sensing histidine kinase KdpD
MIARLETDESLNRPKPQLRLQRGAKLVPGETEVPNKAPTRRLARVREYVTTTALVVVTIGVAIFLRATLGLPDLEMLFLISVMITAVWFGRGPSLYAAALGVAAYDFFFVPPRLTFSVTDPRYFLTFGMMFAIGIVLSELTGRIRRQERDAMMLTEQARAAALRAKTEEMRSSLLSAVSHDLRTPLASITGAATALRDDHNLNQATRVDLVDSICEQAERLEHLVANLLDMTRLESGTLSLKRDWIPLEELIDSALTRLENQAQSHKVRIALGRELPLILVDPVLFEQIFVNLFENAFKYTPPGTLIEVQAAQHGGTVSIVVRDHGPGVATGLEEKLFEKFFRGPTSTTAGAGLGLAICRGIAEAHGGSIRATQSHDGGMSFEVTVPIGGTPPDVVLSEPQYHE